MYYVTMIDNFMSGWGKSENKINYFQVECDNLEDARLIERNAHDRSEMSNINVVREPLESNDEILVSDTYFDDLGAIWKKD